MSICSVACAEDNNERSIPKSSISEKAETSHQSVDALAVKAQDVRRLKVALKKCQVNEKKTERKQKLIKCWNFIKEALVFSAAVIVNVSFGQFIIESVERRSRLKHREGQFGD